jgi:hypothetical protein
MGFWRTWIVIVMWVSQCLCFAVMQHLCYAMLCFALLCFCWGSSQVGVFLFLGYSLLLLLCWGIFIFLGPLRFLFKGEGSCVFWSQFHVQDWWAPWVFFVTGTAILTQCYKFAVCFWKSSSFLLLVSFCLTVAVLFLCFSTITLIFFPFCLPLRIWISGETVV